MIAKSCRTFECTHATSHALSYDGHKHKHINRCYYAPPQIVILDNSRKNQPHEQCSKKVILDYHVLRKRSLELISAFFRRRLAAGQYTGSRGTPDMVYCKTFQTCCLKLMEMQAIQMKSGLGAGNFYNWVTCRNNI